MAAMTLAKAASVGLLSLGALGAGLGGLAWHASRHANRPLNRQNAEAAGETLLSGYAPFVLAPGVDTSKLSGPLLDESRKDPAAVHNRYQLVLTWMHATRVAQAAVNLPATLQMVRSDHLPAISPEFRMDGWNQPFCIWGDAGKAVVVSGGGRNLANCDAVRADAHRAVTSVRDSRLTKVGNVLVTVLSSPTNPAHAAAGSSSSPAAQPVSALR